LYRVRVLSDDYIARRTVNANKGTTYHVQWPGVGSGYSYRFILLKDNDGVYYKGDGTIYDY
jgi:hypothetical protein